MKRILTLLVLVCTFFPVVLSQVNKSKVIGEVFTDFHYIIGDTISTTGISLNRAYFGYNYVPEGDFSSTIIINVGAPEDLAEGSMSRRYAYFREASIAYTKNKMVAYFGMVSTRIFDFQQNFWGKRYLGPEFQAMYGFGSVADLGLVIDYKLNNVFKFDFSLLNGEGYNYVQVDNSLKTAFGITITMPNKISVRLYDDIMKKSGVWQSTMIAFAGVKGEVISLGAEFSYKTNMDLNGGHDLWGISSTGSVYIDKKTDLFARFDYLAAPVDALVKNDYNKYSTYFIGGIQHVFADRLKLSLNFRRTNPIVVDRSSYDAIYLNAGFKF